MLIFQQQQEKPANASPEGRGSRQRDRWCVIPAAGWICMHNTTCCRFGLGLSECAWHFSSSSASPSPASSLSLISGHNRELAQSTCCLLQKHSCLKTHRRYNKSTSTCRDSWPPWARHEYAEPVVQCMLLTAVMMQCVYCTVCVHARTLYMCLTVKAMNCNYFGIYDRLFFGTCFQPGSFFFFFNDIISVRFFLCLPST